MTSPFSPLARRAALVLSVVTLAACTDESTSPRLLDDAGPRLTVGDVFTVTSTSGGADVGSLRWAVRHTTGGEIIRFAPELAGATIVLDSTIRIDYPITIEGPADRGITISGDQRMMVFRLGAPGTTTFRNLTIRDGRTQDGPAVGGSGDAVFENVTVTKNHGGGWSAIALTNITLVNSTVSGNVADMDYSAIRGHTVKLVNSTVANNPKGGIHANGGVTMRNSIVAGNGALNCWLVPAFVYEGKNLSDNDSCGGPDAMTIADPKLDTLADNGGPSATHALLTGSPAMNAGEVCSVTVDQRYVPRDAACDLGAFEFIDFTTIALGVDQSLSVNPNTGWAVVTGTVQCSRGERFDVKVALTQDQRGGRVPTTVQASGTTTVDCGTSLGAWSLVLAPSGGAFASGTATIAAETANTAAWVTPAAASDTVRLYWGHR